MGKCKELMLEKLYQDFVFGDYDASQVNFKLKRDELMIKLIKIHTLLQVAITECDHGISCKDKLKTIKKEINNAMREIR